MNAIELAEGAVTIDAALIAQNLGLEPARVLDLVHAGRITAVYERGVAEDAGLTRVTFRYGRRRLRLIIDQAGRLIERSAIDTSRYGRRNASVLTTGALLHGITWSLKTYNPHPHLSRRSVCSDDLRTTTDIEASDIEHQY